MKRGILYDINESEEERNARDSAVQQLVGRKVNLEATEKEIKIGKSLKKCTYYKMIDPEFEKLVDSISGNSRIFPPGTAGTMDYQGGRLNVYINEEGIVYKVNYG